MLSMIEVRKLSEEYISAAAALSKEIFGPSAYHEVSKWREHYKNKGLLLGAFDGNELVGFKFGYERELGVLHSWLGGVREEYRKQGIAQKLLEAQEKMAGEMEVTSITVNTIRQDYPAMFELLKKNGYEVFDEREEGEQAGARILKSFFRKNL